MSKNDRGTSPEIAGRMGAAKNDAPLSTTLDSEPAAGFLQQPRQPVAQTTSKTLSEQAYEQLRAEIQAGMLLPGTKLSTSALKERFGVSLSTVREALTRLVGDSFVTLQGQRGFRVAPVSLFDLHDLIAMRKLVEGEGIARSLQRGDDAWEGAIVGAFHELRQIETRLETAIQRGNEVEIAEIGRVWEERNARFHMSVISACESPRLLKLYSELYDQTARYRRITFMNQGQALRSVDEEHAAIFDAVISRDVSRAQETASKHLDSIVDFFKA